MDAKRSLKQRVGRAAALTPAHRTGRVHPRAPAPRTARLDVPARRRSAADFLPPRLTLPALAAAASHCAGCDLYRRATQAVFGGGPADARLVLVGEQPGDGEDRVGRPFVGPAGRLLDRALADAGIARAEVYVTNAVKHFKWIARGKRRLHQRPRQGEIDACHPWLAAELKAIRPQALVCLGATAARAAFGRAVTIKDFRGRASETPLARTTFVTIHPSAILRLRDPERAAAYAALVADLKRVREYVG